MSRCSSISSCDALEEHEHIRLPSSRTDETPCKDIVSSMCNENCSQDRSEMSWPCSAQVSCPIELESTVGRQLLQSTPQSSMPCLSEIEEFFAAMENAEKKRFAMRYNFDIDEDVPLEGRYESQWKFEGNRRFAASYFSANFDSLTIHEAHSAAVRVALSVYDISRGSDGGLRFWQFFPNDETLARMSAPAAVNSEPHECSEGGMEGAETSCP
ncbi:hypothetical protein HPP92_013339 [Vanilla planifolia]|uniref:Cyclin-dependent kinase inhibitor domain-containing protein n=1 Tax=Vanilla planifolia TaxID=51239 RepID=A0A835UWK2_VANPL|nr:hypothetical protein HPP92_013339 [Vanilla planifolia]